MTEKRRNKKGRGEGGRHSEMAASPQECKRACPVNRHQHAPAFEIEISAVLTGEPFLINRGTHLQALGRVFRRPAANIRQSQLSPRLLAEARRASISRPSRNTRHKSRARISLSFWLASSLQFYSASFFLVLSFGPLSFAFLFSSLLYCLIRTITETGVQPLFSSALPLASTFQPRPVRETTATVAAVAHTLPETTFPKRPL